MLRIFYVNFVKSKELMENCEHYQISTVVLEVLQKFYFHSSK